MSEHGTTFGQPRNAEADVQFVEDMEAIAQAERDGQSDYKPVACPDCGHVLDLPIRGFVTITCVVPHEQHSIHVDHSDRKAQA